MNMRTNSKFKRKVKAVNRRLTKKWLVYESFKEIFDGAKKVREVLRKDKEQRAAKDRDDPNLSLSHKMHTPLTYPPLTTCCSTLTSQTLLMKG